MIRFKLTTQEKTTHGGYKLPAAGVWFYPEDRKGKPTPCTNTVLHEYSHPVLAVLFNPMHAEIRNPRLFKIQVAKELGTDGLKGWSRAQRIVEEIEVPHVTSTQRAAFAIKVALLVYCPPEFTQWATDWLSGKDRTCAAARDARAARAAYAAADAARDAARDARAACAARAARDAAHAAYAAARAARAARDAAHAARDAAYAADAARAAAYAADAADAAAYAADAACAAYAASAASAADAARAAFGVQLIAIAEDVIANF